MKAYLIRRMIADSLENHWSQALYYEVVGVAMTKEIADRIVAAGGIHEAMVWPPIPPGTPNLQMKEIDVLEEPLAQDAPGM